MSDPSSMPFDSDPSAVQRHRAAASSDRDPVHCPFCDQSFVVRIDLEAHMLAMHGVAQKTKAKKKAKQRRAHYNPTSQATSFKGAFIAFGIVLLFAVVVISLANPGSMKFMLPSTVIVLGAIWFGIARR